MFIKKLDWISPPITLYFKGENSHVSIYSALLSIIAYILLSAGGIYYILEFINREKPKAYFFTRYVEDAGVFPVNATQMFNFIQVSDPNTNKKVPLDFSAFRIVGFDDAYSDDYMKDPSIVRHKNHWLYGNCNNDTDTQGISYLIDQEYYFESACIRKYYDSEKKQYYSTTQSGFRWPVIVKGCSHPERTYYGIIMQRCDEADDFLKEQGPNCKTKEEIDKVVNSVSFNFQIIDHYADMLNYEMPFTKYFYEVTSSITPKHFIIQHLNFNPASMLTHNGFFFDNQVKEEVYFFNQNEKQIIIEDEETSTKGCLIGVYFWMQNILQYYERNYDRIQDTLSDIGGISSIALTIAGILNLLIHNFIILLDTEELISTRESENYNSREMQKRPTIFRIKNNLMYPPRKSYLVRKAQFLQQQSQLSNSRFIKDGTDIYSYSISREVNDEKFQNIYIKRKNILNNKKYENINQEEIIHQNTSRFSKNNNYNRDNYIENHYNENKDTYIRNLKNETNADKKEKIDNKPTEKQGLNWFKYLGYLICCRRNNKMISYYEDFRAKLISEENIIQNYLDIYKLLKVNK